MARTPSSYEPFARRDSARSPRQAVPGGFLTFYYTQIAARRKGAGTSFIVVLSFFTVFSPFQNKGKRPCARLGRYIFQEQGSV
jgi:hypothetical protein